MTSKSFRFSGQCLSGVSARFVAAAVAAVFAFVGFAGAQQPAQPSPPADQAQQASPADAPAQPVPDAAAQQPAQTAPQADSAQQPATPAESQAPAAAPADQPAAAPADASQAAPASQESPAAAQPATTADQAATPAEKAAPAAQAKPASENSQAGGMTEEELRHLLVGKSLYLRGGYLDNNLTFGETGQLIGHSPAGSYTLSGIQIDRVRLTKHKVELEGARYGLHFLGALPYEDPTKAVDRVKITPKKKFVKITIDRELVVTPKKKKEKGEEKAGKTKLGPGGLVIPAEAKNAPAASQPAVVTSADTVQASSQPATAAPADSAQSGAQPGAATQPESAKADSAVEPSDVDQAKAEMASAPKEERPADPGSITTTTSPAHASKLLKDALDKIFAPGLDEQMMAAMPDFWKLYYEAVAAKTDYRPKDPTVLRQSAVDEKAKLTSKFEPESNDFAQDAGVAGMCLYHTVIGADGRASEIAVARPIGFGLDEKAVEAIRRASFQPAVKDGKPVPVLLDLVVQFRIYSKRTNVPSKPEDKDKPAEAQLPGPYTLQNLHSIQAQNPAQSQ